MNIPGRRIDTDEVVFTKPFARGGDGFFLRAQLISKEASASGDLKIEVQTRNAEDSWPGTTLAGDISFTMASASAGDVVEMHFSPSAINGVLEELRLKVSGTGSTTPTAGSGWGLIRVFDPLFYDTASS